MRGCSSSTHLASSSLPSHAIAAPAAATTTVAAERRCRGCGGALHDPRYRHHHAEERTYFYFVLFPTNSSPIFHSNRIPVDLLPAAVAAETRTSRVANPTPAPTAQGKGIGGDGAEEQEREPEEDTLCACCCPQCRTYWAEVYAGYAPSSKTATARPVGDFTRARGLEEAPQQMLQTVAFPSAFGVGSLQPPPPAPTAAQGKKWRKKGRTRTKAARRGTPTALARSSSDDETATEGLSTSPPATDPPPTHDPVAAQVPAKGTDTAAASPPEGPPWNLRLEEVRSANGQLRFHRVVLTATFTVMISSHVGGMHTMQTRHSAVALVITCPPSGDHYRLLLNHFDICRALLHRTLAFGMRTTQRFFYQLFAAQARSVEGGGVARITPQAQQRIMRNITNLLEKDDVAIRTYEALKSELCQALAPRQPLPHLWTMTRRQQQRSGEATVLFPLATRGVGGGPPAAAVATTADAGKGGPSTTAPPAPLWDPSALLTTALVELTAYGEHFLTACIAGILALNRRAGGDSDAATSEDPLNDFWTSLEARAAAAGANEPQHGGTDEGNTTLTTGVSLRRRPPVAAAGAAPPAKVPAPHAVVTQATKLRRPTRGSGGGGTQAPPSGPMAAAASTTMPTAATATEPTSARTEGFSLSSVRKGRVVIFGSDAVLAQRLMVVASFFLTSSTETQDDGAPTGTWLGAARQSYQQCFAVRVDARGAATATAPVQWVPEEFSEQQQELLLSSVYGPDTAILVIAPRLLLCRHLQLQKTLETTTLSIEQQGPGADTAGLSKQAQVAKPFRCRLKSQQTAPPDAMVGTLVKEAVALEQGSKGVVRCASVLRDMVKWLACQDQTRALQHALHGYDVMCDGDVDGPASSLSRTSSFALHGGVGGGGSGGDNSVLSHLRRPSLGGAASAPRTPTTAISKAGEEPCTASLPVGPRPVTARLNAFPAQSRGRSVDSAASLASPGSTRSPTVQDVVLPGSYHQGRGGGGLMAHGGGGGGGGGAPPTTTGSDGLSRLLDARGVLVPARLLSRGGSAAERDEASTGAAGGTAPPQRSRPTAATSSLARFFSGLLS